MPGLGDHEWLAGTGDLDSCKIEPHPFAPDCMIRTATYIFASIATPNPSHGWLAYASRGNYIVEDVQNVDRMSIYELLGHWRLPFRYLG